MMMNLNRYTHITETENGYRLACHKDHTDLIVDYMKDIPGLRYVYCPHCENKRGEMHHVCSVNDIETFAKIYSDKNNVPLDLILRDVYSYLDLY